MSFFHYRPKYWFISFFLILFTVTLTGCIDLSGSRSAYRKNVKKHSIDVSKTIEKHHGYSGEVHTMRGGLGIFSIGMNQLRDTVAQRYKISSRSTMWYNAGDVSRTIVNYYYQHKKHRPIILIGHSLGANEQIKVARNLNDAGVPVALLVTVDAVSQTIVPPNVKHVLNIYKPGYVPMFSGLKVRAVDPSFTVIENINVIHLKGIQVNHFTIDKDDALQAMILDRVKKVLVHDNRKAV